MIEEWKDVVGYEGLYIVSSAGRIKRKSPYRIVREELKQMPTHHGYLVVGLSKNNNLKRIFCHRIVAAAFLGTIPENKQVNHIDKNRKNNTIENLEYITGIENCAHAKFGQKRGLQQAPSGRWAVKVWNGKKYQCIGYYDKKEDAYNAYYIAFKEIRGSSPW
jgi:hypothetical protein